MILIDPVTIREPGNEAAVMSAIVKFEMRQRAPGVPPDTGPGAEIIIFPGVRIERMAIEPDIPTPGSPDGSRRSDGALVRFPA